jgi:hypothetical protein
VDGAVVGGLLVVADELATVAVIHHQLGLVQNQQSCQQRAIAFCGFAPLEGGGVQRPVFVGDKESGFHILSGDEKA